MRLDEGSDLTSIDALRRALPRVPGASGKRARTLTLAATVVGSSLAFVDATVVIVALPRISEDLGLSLAGQQWVYLAYSLALASLYLVAGAVGDRWGRRETFVYGALGFAAASALAGFAPNEAVLIVARALQGVAGAFLTTNSLALLRATFGPESGRAVGLWTSFTGVATIAGPPIGGALVEWASWRWIFFINLPLAAATVLLARAGRCEERAQLRVGRLDIPGAVAAAVAFGAITYAVVEGAERGFGDVWWALVLGALSIAAFVLRELRASEPLLPFGLFRRQNFAAANAETFLVYAAIGGVFVYLTLYLQFLGLTPFQAGLALVPVSLVTIVLAPRAGKLADQNGPRLYLTIGPLLIGAGALLFAFMQTKADLWSMGIAGLACFAVGLSALVAPITATALSSVPSEAAGVAAGVNSTISRLGNLLAVAAIGLVVSLVFERSGGNTDAIPLAPGQGDTALRTGSIDAFRAGMIATAVFAFAGAAVAARWISDEEAKAGEAVPEEAVAHAIAGPKSTC
jgi:EmrB/QacA subfamily drug resistance transporter